MAHAHTEGDRRDVPVSELIRSLLADLVLLARREAELATIELKEKGSSLGIAAGVLTAGVVLALFALGTLISAAVWRSPSCFRPGRLPSPSQRLCWSSRQHLP